MESSSDLRSLRLSIVVPVYRSMAVLPELVSQVAVTLSETEYRDSFELVLVNDCSPDSSWRVIERLADENAFVRGVSLRKNAGQHNATMAGLSFARGETVVIMDDDLQHPPAAILDLARSIEAGHDVCYTRYRERKHVAWKRWGSMFNDRIATWMLKKPSGLYLSSFKAMNRQIVDTVLLYDGPYTYIDSLIISATNSIMAIDISHQDRWAGEGNYNLRRSLSLWLKMVTGSSVYPLRAATVAGFCLAAISMALFVYVVVQKLLHPQIQPGWTSVTATILLIGGMQMLFLGMLGEYVGRIYIRLNKAPQFVVGKTTFDRARPLASRPAFDTVTPTRTARTSG